MHRSHSLAIFYCVAALVCAPSAIAAEAVQFAARNPQVGQQGSHDVRFVLDMSITLKQAGQIVSTEKQSLTREQQRQITIVATAAESASKVRVHYAKATELSTRGTQSGTARQQPIEGRTYLVERQGKDLVITDPQGQAVTDAERVLVAAGMDSVGRPNPLGKFLHGKQMSVGQKLQLPNEMASELLGLRETGGEAQKVELTLRGLRVEQQRRVADFAMLVTLKLGGGGTLDISGDLGLDIDTCQVTAANFTGPVAIEETHGPKGAQFQVSSEGTMKASVQSRHVNPEPLRP